jgi:hypothetical protein
MSLINPVTHKIDFGRTYNENVLDEALGRTPTFTAADSANFAREQLPTETVKPKTAFWKFWK